MDRGINYFDGRRMTHEISYLLNLLINVYYQQVKGPKNILLKSSFFPKKNGKGFMNIKKCYFTISVGQCGEPSSFVCFDDNGHLFFDRCQSNVVFDIDEVPRVIDELLTIPYLSNFRCGYYITINSIT